MRRGVEGEEEDEEEPRPPQHVDGEVVEAGLRRVGVARESGDDDALDDVEEGDAGDEDREGTEPAGGGVAPEGGRDEVHP